MRHQGRKVLADDHEAFVANVEEVEVFGSEDGEVVEGGVEEEDVFGESKGIVSVGDGEDEGGFLELDEGLEGQEVANFLEGLAVLARVGCGRDPEAQEGEHR